ncbi:hypothetical protein GGU11DRAFT_535224 [Lentinula aff. detonsa]|nr:hypothetical protein GGU11DRAFT_535224 [Lentinula aff. detonsa]
MIPLLTYVPLISSFVSVFADSTSSCANTSSLVPFLRAFSSSDNDHFYTTSVSEMDNNALLGGVYTLEGVAAFLWSTPQPGTIPLYRLYNQNSTDHFYTMSSDELPEIMAEGWAYDTAPNHTAGYVYPYSICGAAPIYRLFNPTVVDHFYTLDASESQNAVNAGFQDQGIAGFTILPSANGSVVKDPDSAIPNLLPTTVTASPESQITVTPPSSCANNANAVPLLRAFSGTEADHFYTENSTEMSQVLAAQEGYSFEGDAAFLWSTQETSTVPLYRLFSQKLNDHFYTIDANESHEALSLGYANDTDTGIAGYVYPYNMCGAAPIYRLYNPTSSDHFYTMSQAESVSSRYVIEGVAGFALLPSLDGRAQVTTVSASPLLLPASLQPSPTTISMSSSMPAFTTYISTPSSNISTPSNISSNNKALIQSTVSRSSAVLGVSVLVALFD